MAKPKEISLVKKAYKRVPMTKKEITEFSLCADPESGPEYFIKNFFTNIKSYFFIAFSKFYLIDIFFFISIYT